MSPDKAVDFMNQEKIKEIIRHIEDPQAPKPETIEGAPSRNLGRVIELDSEFLVVMPPNLALRMPKKEGSSPDSVRDQIISMVAMHVKVRETE